MDSKTLLEQRSTYHQKKREIVTNKQLNIRQKQSINQMNALAIKWAIDELTEESMNELIIYLNDRIGNNLVVTGEQVNSIINLVQNMKNEPYPFLISLFGRIDETSQKELLAAGIYNIAVFISIEELLTNPNLLGMYLQFISKVLKPSKAMKQHIFCSKLFSKIFEYGLQKTCESELCRSFQAVTKIWKIQPEDKIYLDFIDGTKYILMLLQDANDSLISLCQGVINVIKYKDINILDILLKEQIISTIITRAHKDYLTVPQVSSLMSIINTIYLNYVHNPRVTKEQIDLLCSQFHPHVFQSLLSFIAETKVSDKSRSDTYFVIEHVINADEYRDIRSVKMFAWLCQRLPLELQSSERVVESALKLIHKFVLILLDLENIVQIILEQKLMQSLLEVLGSQRWGDTYRIMVLMIFVEILCDNTLAENFKRIPNEKMVFEELKNKRKEPLWQEQLEKIEYVLEKPDKDE